MSETVFFKTIADKPEDFFVCIHCDTVNLYENENCFDCGITPKQNQKGAAKVKKWVQKEVEYYEDTEGLSSLEISHLIIDVR